VNAARVLVTDAGRGSAIAAIRSLGRAGLSVIASDHDPRSAGFHSRYANEHVVYPDPAADSQAVVELLRSVAADRGVDLIIPVSDELLLPLARARSSFEGICELALPDDAALAQVTDKWATIELALRIGVPVPRTTLVESTAGALTAADELGWPVVLKPASSRVLREGRIERFEVAYAESPDGVAAAMAGIEGRCKVLVQEYRTGDAHGVELLADDGHPLMAFQHHRLHEVPISGGASSLREGVPLDPVLLGQATRLLHELRWTGLAMVEFRVGGDGPVLMEVNGRIWGSLPLAAKSGVDFPLGLASIYLGARVPGGGPSSATAQELGVRSRDLGRELVWIASVLRRWRRYPFLEAPPRRAALTAALRLPLPQDGFDVFSRDDPSPALADAVHAIRRTICKAGHAS
jgi:predicted ATP-grasp superfamily ATP-dependent carboligase